jgi:hypothetical protein
MALVMTMSPTAVRTARRNLVQRIDRFVRRIRTEGLQPGPKAIANFEVTLECLERADYPGGEDAMMWAIYPCSKGQSDGCCRLDALPCSTIRRCRRDGRDRRGLATFGAAHRRPSHEEYERDEGDRSRDIECPHCFLHDSAVNADTLSAPDSCKLHAVTPTGDEPRLLRPFRGG